jgi:deoxycytidylate deaminase
MRQEYGPCAKVRVFCTITATDGRRFVGENHCARPQVECPRAPGEDYTKCTTICCQEGHAELVALRLAGAAAKGSRAEFRNHSYACRTCQEALFAAGVLSIGPERPQSGAASDQ